MHKKLSCTLLLLMLFMGVTSSCTNKKAPSPEVITTVKLTENIHSVIFMPLYIAMEMGYFHEQGLQINLETFQSEDNPAEHLLTEETNILLAGPEISMYSLQNDDSPAIISIAQIAQDCSYFLLSRETNKPFSWQHLKGKVVIGCYSGEVPEIILEYILKKNDLLPLRNVHIINNLPEETRPGVFESGTGHFILVSEPTATKLEKNLNARVAVALNIPQKPISAYTFMVTTKYLESQEDICRKFITAFSQGLYWVNNHSPEDIAEKGAAYFPREDEKTLLRAVSRYKTLNSWPNSPLLNEEGLNNLQEIMLEQGEINALVNCNDIVNNSLAEKCVETFP